MLRVFVQIGVFNSLCYIPRNRFAGNPMLDTLRNHQALFHSGYPILHSHQHVWGLPFLHPRSLLFPFYYNFLSGCVWFPWWVMMLAILLCAYWPFVYFLLWTLQGFVHFFIGLSLFYWFDCKSFHILRYRSSSNICM